MKARFIAAERIAEDTASFTVEATESFKFEAGQTCDLTLAAPRYQDEKGTSRTFSIASSPADLPRLTFATRLTGSAFKKSLLEAAAGTDVDVDGPYGSFTLHKNSAKPALLFAGGIGITPFRSIIKDATERRLPHHLTLFYSNRIAASTAFLPDLERWSRENPHFRLVATIGERRDGDAWAHGVGLFNAQVLTPHLADAGKDAIAYIAGPPPFVTAMRASLEQLGADPDNIRTEEFSGY
jgi:ferredoxin-NADP reductase